MTFLLIFLFISLGLIIIVGLFCLLPLKYELKIKFKNQIFYLDFNYLFFSFAFMIGFTEQMKYKATVFGKTIFDSNKDSDEENKNDIDNNSNEDVDLVSDDFIKDKTIEYEVNNDEKIIKDLSKRSKEYEKEINEQLNNTEDNLININKLSDENNSQVDIDKMNEDDDNKKDIENLAETEKSKNAFFELIDNLMNIVKNRVPIEMFELIKVILNEVKKIFRCIKPKVVKYDAKIGLDDPYHMGLLLSLHAPLYALYGDNVKLTPYFDRYLLDLELYMMGRPQIIFMLIPILRLYFNKKFRKIVFHKH